MEVNIIVVLVLSPRKILVNMSLIYIAKMRHLEPSHYAESYLSTFKTPNYNSSHEALRSRFYSFTKLLSGSNHQQHQNKSILTPKAKPHRGNPLTVGFLVSGSSSWTSKLLGLASTRVRNQQGFIVGD